MARGWKTFYREWSKCTRCGLHENATHHVLYDESDLPPFRSDYIDVLFIGEAPGISEDLIGRPFIGVSGKILRAMIDASQKVIKYSYGITNCVACIPYQDVGTSKIRKPNDKEVQACMPRVLEILRLSEPELVILLGKTAQAHFESYITNETNVVCEVMVHPAYVCRCGGIGSDLYHEQLDRLNRILKTNLT